MTARAIAALLAGALFGAGLAISRMTDPAVVLGFLDVFGAFDPTLGFVLAGAVSVTTIAFRFVLRRPKPLLAERFELPTRRDLDATLLGGAAIFGVGWGLVGLCPGPALVSLAAGVPSVVAFVAAMLLGAGAYRALRRAASVARAK